MKEYVPAWIEVENSSIIKAFRYDKYLGTLDVCFNTKTVYRYTTVSEQLYQEMLDADSKGSFFNRFIKILPCEKIS